MTGKNHSVSRRAKHVALVEALYNGGLTIDQISMDSGISRETVKSIVSRIKMAEEEESFRSTPVHIARTIHSNERVVIDGKKYIDITDYIVDCGAMCEFEKACR